MNKNEIAQLMVKDSSIIKSNAVEGHRYTGHGGW